jgi:hypothetical protein
MLTRLDDLTLSNLVIAANMGTAHPTDVLRLVEEVRWYRALQELLPTVSCILLSSFSKDDTDTPTIVEHPTVE